MSSTNNELIQGKYFLNIAIHVTILFTILGNLFILYISKLSSESLNNHLISTVDASFKDTSKTIENYIKSNNLNNNNVSNYINNIDYNYYKKLYATQDTTRQLVNQQVVNKIIHVNILLIIITILFSITLLITKNINYEDIKDLLFENVISFTIIGIIEYLFFTNIALYYVPTPPSHILKNLFTNLQN